MFFLQIPGIGEVEKADSSFKAKIATQLDDLSHMPTNEIVNKMIGWLIDLGKDILIALIIWYVGRWIIRRIKKVTEAILEKRKVDISVRGFLQNLISITLNIILLITILSTLEVNTTSFVALFASAGLAIGMALSGTLQNFAGGVMLLLLRPYKVGDFIEAQGQSGTVKTIQLFNTIITTPDNKTIIIPNGPISTSIINNYSTQSTRRIEWIVSINYGDDFEQARSVIEGLLNADSRILHKKGLTIEIKELAESSVNIVVRAWSKAGDYWPVYFDINAKIYKTLPEKGIDFPYNHLDVHLTK